MLLRRQFCLSPCHIGLRHRTRFRQYPGNPHRLVLLPPQIVNHLKAPDLIGIEEMQDDSGPANDGTVSATGGWQRLIASIVAISGIHLLKVFMDIQKYDAHEVYWMVIIHAVFVTSGVMLALMDYLVQKSKKG
jgi:hypothetical protein